MCVRRRPGGPSGVAVTTSANRPRLLLRTPTRHARATKTRQHRARLTAPNPPSQIAADEPVSPGLGEGPIRSRPLGHLFPPASRYCDQRPGELALVGPAVAQHGQGPPMNKPAFANHGRRLERAPMP